MTNDPRRPIPTLASRWPEQGAETTIDLIVPRPRPRAPDPAPPRVVQVEANELLPHLLSVDDLEKRFRRSARTIRRWVERGHLPPVRVGGAVFFRADDVQRLTVGQSSDAASAWVRARARRRQSPFRTQGDQDA